MNITTCALFSISRMFRQIESIVFVSSLTQTVRVKCVIYQGVTVHPKETQEHYSQSLPYNAKNTRARENSGSLLMLREGFKNPSHGICPA